MTTELPIVTPDGLRAVAASIHDEGHTLSAQSIREAADLISELVEALRAIADLPQEINMSRGHAEAWKIANAALAKATQRPTHTLDGKLDSR